MAALLACGPGAVLCHRSAAALLDLRACGGQTVDVTVPSRAGRARDGIAVHRGAGLARADLTEVSGIRCTSVARTLLDLAEVVDRRTLERALDEAEVLRVYDQRALDDVLERAGRRHGRSVLEAVLAEHAIGTTLTREELEARFLALCDEARLPRPRVNYFVALDQADYVIDFAWPEWRLAVETDGRRFHGGRLAFERDRRRDQQLTVAGWRPLRFTWRQVVQRPADVVATLRALSRRSTPPRSAARLAAQRGRRRQRRALRASRPRPPAARARRAARRRATSVFVVRPLSIVSKSQRGRSPPGACTVTRMREPARNACATGKIGTRTSVELALGQRRGVVLSRWVGNGSSAVDGARRACGARRAASRSARTSRCRPARTSLSVTWRSVSRGRRLEVQVEARRAGDHDVGRRAARSRTRRPCRPRPAPSCTAAAPSTRPPRRCPAASARDGPSGRRCTSAVDDVARLGRVERAVRARGSSVGRLAPGLSGHEPKPSSQAAPIEPGRPGRRRCPSAGARAGRARRRAWRPRRRCVPAKRDCCTGDAPASARNW